MKKLRNIYSTIIASILLFGCSNDLNVFPEDSINTASLTKDDVPVLVNGTLEKLKDAFIPFHTLDFDVYGENFQFIGNSSPIQTLAPDNRDLYNIWSKLYSSVFNANTLIDVASKFEGKDIDNALATAYFVRAYAYYNLVTRFGGVPLLEQNSNKPVKRATEAETWDFILKDLNKALKSVPDFSSPFYVSTSSVNGLAARVHLSLKNMELANTYAQAVINTKKFSFESDYQSVFFKNGGTELIFGLSNFEGDLEIWRAANATNFTPPGGAGYTPRQDLFDTLFETGDARKQATFINFKGQLMLNKYSTNQKIPILVMRLSEMYLIRAESLGLNKGGLIQLNLLRSARRLVQLNPKDEVEFQEFVALERRRELYGEGFLFYDLVRTGKAVEQLQFINDINKTKLPIPQQEVDLAGLTQNLGY